MKLLVYYLSILIAFSTSSLHAQLPADFTWLDLEQPSKTLNTVRFALKDIPKTSIREIGIKGNFALAMIAYRENGAPTQDYDQWSVYNISLTTGQKQILLFGYGVTLVDWIGINKSELEVTYFDCWECEAAKLFTTFYFTPRIGWLARWPDTTTSNKYPHPGVLISSSDCGDCSDNEIINQVFAILDGSEHNLEAGYWVSTKNIKEHTTSDSIYRYSIDPKTGKDVTTELKGSESITFKKKLCTYKYIVAEPHQGQDSEACRALLKAP